MGLTNNVIVKGAVDILTMLLNIVNKLTGVFGDAAGSVLKFVTAAMAFKGLKTLFMSGGLFENGLLKAFSGTALETILTKIGIGKAAEGTLSKAAAGEGTTIGKALFGGITTALKSVWASFESFGTLLSGGALTGATAGFASLAVEIGLVVAALIAA